jgi:dTDP-glucose 4,6-dehydratase
LTGQSPICDEAAICALFNEVWPNAVLHLAAESHVDRSITDSRSFMPQMSLGHTMLESARRYWLGLKDAANERFWFLH